MLENSFSKHVCTFCEWCYINCVLQLWGFFSFRGASPFNFHYAFSRSWSYNHTIFILFLLWIFLRNGKTILSIEGTFGDRYNWELKSKTNNWLEMHERKWRLLNSLNHFLSYMSAAEIRQLDMDFLFAFMCFMWK